MVEPLNKPWTRYCGCRDMKENLGYCVNCGYKIQPEPTSPSVKPIYTLLQNLKLAEHKIDQHLQGQYNNPLYPALGVALACIRRALLEVERGS